MHNHRRRTTSRYPSGDRLLIVGLMTSAAVLGVGCGRQHTSTAQPEPGHAVVHEVVDGDTIKIVVDDRIHQVRLLGVDAPETVHPTKPEQCYGRQASDRLRSALPVGSAIRLTRDIEARDHFDRLLLYVHRNDGLFVNQWLVEEGLADSVFYEPNTYHRIELTRAANRARADGVGLWGVCEGPDQPLP